MIQLLSMVQTGDRPGKEEFLIFSFSLYRPKLWRCRSRLRLLAGARGRSCLTRPSARVVPPGPAQPRERKKVNKKCSTFPWWRERFRVKLHIWNPNINRSEQQKIKGKLSTMSECCLCKLCYSLYSYVISN